MRAQGVAATGGRAARGADHPRRPRGPGDLGQRRGLVDAGGVLGDQLRELGAGFRVVGLALEDAGVDGLRLLRPPGADHGSGGVQLVDASSLI